LSGFFKKNSAPPLHIWAMPLQLCRTNVRYDRLVALEGFGLKKALFLPGYVIPKAFGTPNMPHFDCKNCLARQKNINFSRSNPSTATSLMPVTKIEKKELLRQCWHVFNRHGYYGTSVQMLAEATGLGKSGLMHHYASKENLMRAVVEFAHEAFRDYVIAVAQEPLPPEQRLEKLLRRQNRLAKHERRGCFFANTALETGREELFNDMVQAAFKEWQETVAGILRAIMPQEQAASTAYRLLLEYEGAVTIYKLTGDESHLEQFVGRAVSLFDVLKRPPLNPVSPSTPQPLNPLNP
jgi:TetR/AcrR family transcriptional repressor of nem operon